MPPTGQTPERPLVLLAEPQAILALDIATELEEAGFAVAGPFASRADLRAWTDAQTPQAALLHLNLLDGSCLPEAAELARRSIPVAVFTISGDGHGHGDLTWIVGPAEPRVLVRFVKTRFGRR